MDTNLAFTNGAILDDGATVTGQVSISYDPVVGASYSTTGLLTNADFQFVQSALVPNDAYTFVFSARVGGANQTVLVDNLVISLGTAGPPFIITDFGYDAGARSATITWNSIAGHSYAVDFSTDLRDDVPNALPAWQELTDSVIATGASTSFTETNIPVGTEQRYYRVRDLSAR